jgi:hypothetical protein
MDKTDNMPIWVFLAFSSINTRKAALLLIASSALFTVYCAPWTRLFPGSEWIGRLFLLDDWSWFAMMLPVTLWYWLSLNWLDRHAAWATRPGGSKDS